MMVRYIDADMVKNAVCVGCNKEFEERPCEPSFCDIRNAIEDLPNADVVEVKHGEWKKHRDDGDCEYIECSVCREEFYPPDNEFTFDRYPNYCQECGAKMDVSKTEITTDGGKKL